MLVCTHSVNSCTCCVVFVVVYDVRYGVEGVFLSQEELPGVTYFDLVMPDVPASTADNQKKERYICKYSSCVNLWCVCFSCDVKHLSVLV